MTVIGLENIFLRVPKSFTTNPPVVETLRPSPFPTNTAYRRSQMPRMTSYGSRILSLSWENEFRHPQPARVRGFTAWG